LQKRSRQNSRKTAKRKKDYKKEVDELAVNKEFSTEEVETKLTKVGGELITARDKILETLKHNKNQLHSYIQSLEALKNELQIVIIKDHTESDKKKILFEEEFLNTFQKTTKKKRAFVGCTKQHKVYQASGRIEQN
jgi:recombinational DNA repair ATPase RecF